MWLVVFPVPIQFDNGEISYSTVSCPLKKKRQGAGREKGHALQSRTLPNFFMFQFVSLQVCSPIARNLICEPGSRKAVIQSPHVHSSRCSESKWPKESNERVDNAWELEKQRKKITFALVNTIFPNTTISSTILGLPESDFAPVMIIFLDVKIKASGHEYAR
jgi:hypothetical protein